jgi:hypothetical protein
MMTVIHSCSKHSPSKMGHLIFANSSKTSNFLHGLFQKAEVTGYIFTTLTFTNVTTFHKVWSLYLLMAVMYINMELSV